MRLWMSYLSQSVLFITSVQGHDSFLWFILHVWFDGFKKTTSLALRALPSKNNCSFLLVNLRLWIFYLPFVVIVVHFL